MNSVCIWMNESIYLYAYICHMHIYITFVNIHTYIYVLCVCMNELAHPTRVCGVCACVHVCVKTELKCLEVFLKTL